MLGSSSTAWSKLKRSPAMTVGAAEAPADDRLDAVVERPVVLFRSLRRVFKVWLLVRLPSGPFGF